MESLYFICKLLHFSVQFDGKLVVSGAYDYLVKVWDPLEGTCLHTLSGHTNRVYSLQVIFSRVNLSSLNYIVVLHSMQFDGVHIVSGSLDTHIRVWKADSGLCLHTLKGRIVEELYTQLFDSVHYTAGHQSLTSGMELKSNTLVSGNADSTVKVSNYMNEHIIL